jgi:fructose/tagatose bisphosphate aldolase
MFLIRKRLSIGYKNFQFSNMNNKTIDSLVWQVQFGTEKQEKKAFQELWHLGRENGIFPASINDLYLARGRKEVSLDFTVPAMNLRGMSYDMARAVFKIAQAKKVGALILELARSEMGYTDQSPRKYSGTMVGAALREGFRGPLFIQADHFQVKCSEKPGVVKEGEGEKIKKLIKESIEARFYNIDLDLSTLVDYSQKEISEQQRTNFSLAVKLTQYIRKIEPRGITVSLGGEIGHIGGRNSTEEELRAYMEGYHRYLPKGMTGLAKMAIQTGTHHGGVPLADGTLADVDVDFGCLKRLAQVSREYGMGGTVQHGASTLPDEYFAQFVKAEAIEVHLATGFQNIVLDHPQFPKTLLKKMYQWLDKECQEERKEGQTEKQFHYQLRKKAWGRFKKACWQLPEKSRKAIKSALEKRFSFLFKELGVEKTKTMVAKWIRPAQENSGG